MEALLLKSRSKSDLKLLMELAKKLGINVKQLSLEEVENIGLVHSIKEGKTGEFVDPNEFVKKLRKKS